MRGVEVVGDLALDLDLLGLVARAEAAVPADEDVARLGFRVVLGSGVGTGDADGSPPEAAGDSRAADAAGLLDAAD